MCIYAWNLSVRLRMLTIHYRYLRRTGNGQDGAFAAAVHPTFHVRRDQRSVHLRVRVQHIGYCGKLPTGLM